MTLALTEFEGLQTRLSAALSRLEGELDGHRRNAAGTIQELEVKLAQLSAERDQLRAALEAAEEEANRLKQLARAMADELNKAASQIEGLLGDGASAQ